MNENKILIIYAHPWGQSFNHAILDSVKKALDEKKSNYDIIDLNKEKFNPVYGQEELALYSKAKFLDPKIGEYQKKIENSSSLIFIFPIWWADMPAILKGFLEKVFLPGWAYTPTNSGMLHGKLTNLKKAVVITTMGSPKIYYNFILGNPIKKILINNTLIMCGIKKCKLLQLGRTQFITKTKREKWLTQIGNYIKKSIL
jgi:NAD(P)H dehydrogenase (quinone)